MIAGLLSLSTSRGRLPHATEESTVPWWWTTAVSIQYFSFGLLNMLVWTKYANLSGRNLFALLTGFLRVGLMKKEVEFWSYKNSIFGLSFIKNSLNIIILKNKGRIVLKKIQFMNTKSHKLIKTTLFRKFSYLKLLNTWLQWFRLTKNLCHTIGEVIANGTIYKY